MKRLRVSVLLFSLAGYGWLGPATVSAQRLSAATDGQRPAEANPGTQKFAGPIQLFDDLYYVGTNFVSAYVLVTADGLIMFDSLYDEFTNDALAAIRDVGLDPTEIRYVVVTHGHDDHSGGVRRIREVSGARVVMTGEDWAMTDLDETGNIVARDGDSIVLGDTVLNFYQTPGHTPGVLSTEFLVHDRGRPHKAFLFGGHNVTSNQAGAFEVFIDSVERLRRDLSGVEVSLTSHPWAALIFERSALLAARLPGGRNPFVDAEDFEAFLDERIDNARSRLAALR
jgi:metallo-beta-lactamase class B